MLSHSIRRSFLWNCQMLLSLVYSLSFIWHSVVHDCTVWKIASKQDFRLCCYFSFCRNSKMFWILLGYKAQWVVDTESDRKRTLYFFKSLQIIWMVGSFTVGKPLHCSHRLESFTFSAFDKMSGMAEKNLYY